MKKRVVAGLCALACAVSIMAPVSSQVRATSVSARAINAGSEVSASSLQYGGIVVPVVKSFTFNGSNYGYEIGELDAATTTEKVPLYITERGSVDIQIETFSENALLVNFTLLAEDGTAIATKRQVTNQNVEGERKVDVLARDIVLEPGTYYVDVTMGSTNVTAPVMFGIYAVSYTAPVEEEIEMAKLVTGYAKDQEYIYKKIKVTKDGLLTINAYEIDSTNFWNGADSKSGAEITLCSAKKKELDTTTITNSGKKFQKSYAVTKGTYYIRLTGDNAYYYMVPTFKKIALGNSKKAKAIKVTSSFKSYIMPVNSSDAGATRWFKFTLKKPKDVVAYIDYIGDNEVNVQLYRGKKLLYTETDCKDGGTSIVTKDRYGNRTKWAKGTYYIKVTRGSAYGTANGILSVKVK